MTRHTTVSEGPAVFAGIDYHKKFSVVTIGDKDGARICQEKLINDEQVITKFFNQHPAMICAIENCRGTDWYIELLKKLGHEVRVSNTYAVKLISESRCKTDKIDSRILMELLAKGFLPTIYQPSREERLLRERLRFRTQLVRSRAQYKNCAHALLDKENRGAQIDSQKRRVDAIEHSGISPGRQELLELQLDVVEHFEELVIAEDKWIGNVAKNNPNARLLTTIPGVGEVSALILLAELGDIKRFKRARDLAGYLGLVPRLYSSSDTRRMGSITKHGSGFVRWILVQDAWIAIRYCKPLLYRFNKISKRKGKKVAIVAIARMLAEIVYRVLRDQKEFDETLLTLG